MPSLLQKLSYFDPETGGTFTIASDGFYWKEGKKHPDDSKVTKLVKQYGWKLMNGNDAWLIFKQKGNPGELFVVRGNKRWFYDLPDEDLYGAAMKGKGLDSLKEALDEGVLTKALAKAASPGATAVNNAGNGHASIDGGNPLWERRVGYDATDDDLGPAFWPAGERKLSPEEEKSKADSDQRTKEKFERIHKIIRDKSKGVLSSKLLQAREPMHDDSGARTGLRSRPDYGESDSYTSEMNRENSKGACLVLKGNIKTASGSTRADLYIASVEYERGYAFKLAKFGLTADPDKAKLFMPRTAENLSRQVRRLCGQSPKIKQAGESTLNGFPIMSLEDFVGDNEPDEKFAASPVMGPEIQRTQPATEQEFGLGSKHREMSDEEMREYMERIENRSEYEKEKEKTKGQGKKTEEQKAEEERVKSERQKDKYSLPILHRGNIHIVDNDGREYDLDKLKADIMKRPEKLLKKNEKMQHSGVTKQYYNIGLAALKGLAVNEKTGKFVVVDTCPGAGICKTYCYAMRGNYIRVAPTSLNQSRILNFLVNYPEKFKAMLKAEIGLAESRADEGTKIVIRWHDAGDFFSPQYMNLAFDVAESFPDVEFYAYTKVGDVANAKKPKNFIINFSEGALPGETKKVDLTQIKSSITVPQKRFWDLIVTKGAHTVKNELGQVQFKDAAAWDTMKDRLVEDYKIKKDSILLYNEYMAKKQEGALGDKPKWNVVVPPGGGDDAANDPVVIGSYLMWH